MTKAKRWGVGLLVTVAALAPTVAQEAPSVDGGRFWGSYRYEASVQDSPTAQGLDGWALDQVGEVTLNFQSRSGVEWIADLKTTYSSLTDRDLTVNSVVKLLSLRLLPVDTLAVVVGKQRLKWGTGKIFSAIDKGEARSNPLDPQPVLDGVTGVRIEFLPSDWLGLSLIGLPDQNPSRTQGALRAEFTLQDEGVDLGIGVFAYNYFPWAESSSLLSGAVLTGTPETTFLRRGALMADAAWGLGDFTLYGEGEARWGRESGYWTVSMAAAEDFGSGSRDQLVLRGLAGLLYRLSWGGRQPADLVAEYLFNGDGLNTSEAQALSIRRAPSPRGLFPDAYYSLGGLRRHYAGLSLSSVALDSHVMAQAQALLGIDSSLIMANLGVTVDLGRNTRLSLEGMANRNLSSSELSEIDFLPFRLKVTGTLSAGF